MCINEHHGMKFDSGLDLSVISVCRMMTGSDAERRAMIGWAEYTCFTNSRVCRAGVIAGCQQKARRFRTAVLLAHAGVPHGSSLLWGCGDVTSCAAVCWQHWWEMKRTKGKWVPKNNIWLFRTQLSERQRWEVNQRTEIGLKLGRYNESSKLGVYPWKRERKEFFLAFDTSVLNVHAFQTI